MNILLDENTKLGSDSLNWILYKKRKGGWKAIGFFSDLPPLIYSYIERSLKESSVTKLEELSVAMIKMEKRIVKQFDDYSKD